ncbi:MAG: hypothetical protein ABEJ67_05045 [Halanaeroarchaeum sp.]
MSQWAPALDHPAWRSSLGVVVGYAIVLLTIFVLFFLVPYALFAFV